MARFHVSQDETGYFQLTLENDAGELRLVSYQAKTAEQLIERAIELVRSGEFGNATIVADVAVRSSAEAAPAAAVARAAAATPAAAAERSWRPAPRKAGA
jgi:uncharacterized protein YegP (UPF0339 family)